VRRRLPLEGIWRRWRSLADMRTPRHGLGGVSRGNRIYAIEGGDQPGFHFTRTLEYLDLGSRLSG